MILCNERLRRQKREERKEKKKKQGQAPQLLNNRHNFIFNSGVETIQSERSPKFNYELGQLNESKRKIHPSTTL